ncbi:alpha/beta hydrolase [Bosea sp. BH3]|uniref:alpha/beta hydrolase n=1 Tax=Bosea sp. BH3 TaxID=2871701 RepID=UPI0021CB66E1|nr:alpha/beta hydrolase [Bosea sp. BH3]MCU4181528.1 alpha/beta hydrolase [Bosea sp. BH3]
MRFLFAASTGRLWAARRPVAGKRACLALVFVASVLAAGCASRPETGFLAPVAEADSGSTAHTLLVATTRKRDDRPGTLFSGERSTPLDFARIVVSVPEKHAEGEIEWASTAPGNPKTDFVVRQAGYLDSEKAFVSALNAQLAAKPKGKRNIFLFIHGYNTMFAEGLYRFAQLVHDSRAEGVPVLFTWASRGQVTQYVYDTNSATAARDDLERTIRLLLASNADQVNILAHSMGNWVTVEALRQIRISGIVPQASKVGHVVLAAPDIDIDVFKSQMRRFGKPKRPFVIVLSKDDKALGASNFIAGGRGRLGADSDPEELAALGAIVLDMTEVKGLDSSNHGKFAQLAAVAPKLAAALERGAARPHPSAKAGEIAEGSLEALVKLPITIIGAPFRILSGS